MTTFNDREKAFESKFALDEELNFKSGARRNKLLGLWAAEKLGKTGSDAESYAKEVVLADFEEDGDHDVVNKILKDFSGAKIAISEKEIRAQMESLLAVARKQVLGEKK